MPIEIIAEAGVNHNGSLERALELVDQAAEAGADWVKFQTFRADDLATAAAAKADYQQRTTGAAESQHAMLKRLELSAEAHHALAARCAARGIGFLSTPFDAASAHLLIEALRLPVLKVSSGDLTNGPLLLALARSGRRLILSTGMATLGEIEEALGIVAYGLQGGDAPSRAAFRDAYARAGGSLAARVTLLHCTTQYPTPFEDVNLRAMATLSAAFGLPVGYSDHTLGITVPVAAAALGAVVLEKHFTLDRGLPGPDHAASLEPAELAEMVRAVRRIEAALGSGRKLPAPAERDTMAAARKSLVAARPIAKGQLLTADDLTAKRPGTGLPPNRLWELVGRRAARSYAADEMIAE